MSLLPSIATRSHTTQRSFPIRANEYGQAVLPATLQSETDRLLLGGAQRRPVTEAELRSKVALAGGSVAGKDLTMGVRSLAEGLMRPTASFWT